MSQIRELIREKMESNDWGVRELATAANTSHATLSRWLSGQTKINSETLERVMAAARVGIFDAHAGRPWSAAEGRALKSASLTALKLVEGGGTSTDYEEVCHLLANFRSQSLSASALNEAMLGLRKRVAARTESSSPPSSNLNRRSRRVRI